MCAVQIDPEWYTAALKNLALIEDNASDYEDPEEGDVAPTAEVFSAVAAFLKSLLGGDETLEVPRMFVSSNGHLLVIYGNKNQSLDLRFSPTITFTFQLAKDPAVTGADANAAAALVKKHFRA